MDKPRVLVFQHMEAGHPGVFRDFLRRDGIAWRGVRLDLGEPIPDLADFRALWVMGGPQDVWQEAEHPWLIADKAATPGASPNCGRSEAARRLAEGVKAEMRGPAEAGPPLP